MFKFERRHELLYLTILFAVVLVTIITTQKLNRYDTYLIYILLFTLFYLLKSLIEKNEDLIDRFHIFYIFLAVLFSLFINNVYLVVCFIMMFFFMLTFWIADRKCPLGEFTNYPYVVEILDYTKSLYIWHIGLPFLIFVLLNKIYKFVDFYSIMFVIN